MYKCFFNLDFKVRVGTLTTLFFFGFHFSSMGQMRQIYVDGNQNNAISKISFYSASNGFVAFNNWIGYTTDSGRSYTQKNITINNVNFNGYSVNLTFGFGINGVKAFDQNNVIVYGDYGLVPAILHSANGGNTFTLIYHSQFNLNQLSTGITDMVFPQNNSIGYAIDADRILKTTNQGLSWNVVRTDPGSFFSDLDAVDNNTVYAYNSDIVTVKLVKTVNAGLNWSVVTLPAGNDYINCANFISADKGWLNMRTNTEGKLYQTTNGGTTWVQVNDNEATPVFAKKLKFINDTAGYAIAGIFTIYKTINSGRSWEPLPKDNNYTYLNFTHNDLQMHSSSQFWAGGAHGFLELTSNGGGTPIAKAYFKIDISNVAATGTVNLVNFSNTHYTYKWYKNGELLSTSYNSNYVHDLYKLRDTIKLIVSDNNVTDTAIKYIDFPPPIFITSFTPATGNPGTTITISGNNLTSTTGVFFGGVPAASFSIISPTQINAVVGQGATGHVTIANLFRQDSLPGFRFTGIAITSIVPNSGIMGDVITIKGLNFLQAASVSFGGTPASSFTIVDSVTIRAVVGPGTSGNVVINATNGLATFPGFTYTGPTTITSFTPVSAGPRSTITITGINFIGASAVSFGGTPALSYTVVSATTIQAVVNTGSSGNVSVTTPANNTNLSGFIFTPIPLITSFSPESGVAGVSVIITGNNFITDPSSNHVFFGSVKAIVTAATATQLTVTVPAGATYNPISITCNKLTAVSKKPFLLTFSAPGSTFSSSSFAQKINFNTQNVPGCLFYDFDGDSKSDMLITDMYAYKFTVSKNISTTDSIMFATPLVFSTGTSFNAPHILVKVADFDGDGKLDIILRLRGTDYGEIGIYVYKNISDNGVIAFGPRVTITNIPAGPTLSGLESILLTDFDTDGKMDMLVWHGNVSPEVLYFYRNSSINGIISFVPATIIYYAESTISSASLGDINSDGKTDILLTELSSSGRITVLLNNTVNGSISFAPKIQFNTNENGLRASMLSDLDGDDKPDLILPNYIFNRISVLRNLSTTGTVAFSPVTNYLINGKPNSLSCGDIDGDAKPDFAVSVDQLTSQPQTISVYKNTSTSGSISFAVPVNYSVGSEPGQISIGDLNGDSKPELAFGNGLPSAVSILKNKVTGTVVVTSVNPVSATDFGIKYSPNPATDKFTIFNLKLSDKWQELYIVGMDGRQVLSNINITQKIQVEVPLNRLVNGNYTAVLTSKNGNKVFLKFTKL